MEQLLMAALTYRSIWSLPVTKKDRSTAQAAVVVVPPRYPLCPITSWATNKTYGMRIQKNARTSKRLIKKTLLFQILNQDPDLTALQLLQRAEEAGIKLTLLGAYRTLRTFAASAGQLENSESRCVKTVSAILKDAAPGEHLTAVQIKERAEEQGLSLHQATVYRVLARLSAIGLVLAIDKGRQKLYEWKREEGHHGHLSCIKCGKTIEFYQDYLDELGRQVSLHHGYDFARIEFIVRSICATCRNRDR